jgi:hypothetical protein
MLTGLSITFWHPSCDTLNICLMPDHGTRFRQNDPKCHFSKNQEKSEKNSTASSLGKNTIIGSEVYNSVNQNAQKTRAFFLLGKIRKNRLT